MERAGSGRALFLDGLRGLAIMVMVVNHTARWWLDRSLGWPRYHLIYLSVPLSAPLFLFLAGFCLPLSYLSATVDRGQTFGAVVGRYLWRGAKLVMGGWLLTLLVFPQDPLFGGEVLQAIGVSIAALMPVLLVLRWRVGRVLAVAAAVACYASFHAALPSLSVWLRGHPVVSEVLFTGFPPWPWFAFPLLGAALGWSWAERHRRGADEQPYFAAMLGVGLVCLAAYLPLELWLGAAPWHFANSRDIGLNGHWNPGAVTCLLILGHIFTLMPLVHQAMEVRGIRPRWLVVLGQNSLMLYFVHQVIARTLVRQHLGMLLDSWWLYALAYVALLVVLFALARLWPEIKGRARAWWAGPRRPAPAPAS